MVLQEVSRKKHETRQRYSIRERKGKGKTEEVLQLLAAKYLGAGIFDCHFFDLEHPYRNSKKVFQYVLAFTYQK